jgi:hypothetical protein
MPAQLFTALIRARRVWCLYGYPPDEVIGQPMTTPCPLDRTGEVSDILAKVGNGERIMHYEER